MRRIGKFYGGGGFEAEVTYENKRANKVREETTFGGMTGVSSFDGKTGWKIEPWAGKKDPESLGEDETKGIVEDAEFDDPLFNYQQRGNKVELIENSIRWKAMERSTNSRLRSPATRRRAHVLSRRRIVRADQVRGEAHRARRRKLFRG